MNTTAVLLASALVTGGGVAGYWAWDEWVGSDVCQDEGSDMEADGPVTVLYTIRNDGGAARVEVCVEDADGVQQSYTAFDLAAQRSSAHKWTMPAAPATFVAQVASGTGEAVARTHVDLTNCPDPVEIGITVDVSQSEVSLSSNGSNCSSGASGDSASISQNGGASEAKVDFEGPFPAVGDVLNAPPGFALGALSGGLLAIPILRHPGAARYLVAAGFTRLVKPKLLDQQVRAQIHQLVQVEPGIHPQEMLRRLEVGTGTLAYHLRVLEREQLVTSVGGPVRRHYFVAGRYTRDDMRRRALLRDDALAHLYQLVREQPGANLTTLATGVGRSRSRASRMAKQLENAGLLERLREGRDLRLFPAAGAKP